MHALLRLKVRPEKQASHASSKPASCWGSKPWVLQGRAECVGPCVQTQMEAGATTMVTTMAATTLVSDGHLPTGSHPSLLLCGSSPESMHCWYSLQILAKSRQSCCLQDCSPQPVGTPLTAWKGISIHLKRDIMTGMWCVLCRLHSQLLQRRQHGVLQPQLQLLWRQQLCPEPGQLRLRHRQQLQQQQQ